MDILIWKPSFKCISLIFKSDKGGLQPCRTFQLPLSFSVLLGLCAKTEQNKPPKTPDPVFCLLQPKTFPHPQFVEPPAASSVSSHPMLMPFLIPKPIPRSKLLLLSWQLTGKQGCRKAAQGIFYSLQRAIFDLLSQKSAGI